MVRNSIGPFSGCCHIDIDALTDGASEARAMQVLYDFLAFFDFISGFLILCQVFIHKKSGFLILFLKIPALAVSTRMVMLKFHIREIGKQSTQAGFLKSFQESCIFWIHWICRKCTNWYSRSQLFSASIQFCNHSATVAEW